MRKATLVLLLVAMIAGCASSAPDPRGAMIDFDARVAGTIFFGAGDTAPATIEVGFVNRGTQPVTVRRVRVETPTMQQLTIGPIERNFREVIEPGGTSTLTIFATARTIVRDPREPLSMRITVQYEDAAGTFREIYTR
jgi:hypothetical protein